MRGRWQASTLVRGLHHRPRQVTEAGFSGPAYPSSPLRAPCMGLFLSRAVFIKFGFCGILESLPFRLGVRATSVHRLAPVDLTRQAALALGQIGQWGYATRGKARLWCADHPPQPCIRLVLTDRDHDAVMRIGGEAPQRRADSSPRHQSHGALRATPPRIANDAARGAPAETQSITLFLCPVGPLAARHVGARS